MRFKCTVTVVVSGLFKFLVELLIGVLTIDIHVFVYFFYLTKLQSYWFVKMYKTFNDQHLS